MAAPTQGNSGSVDFKQYTHVYSKLFDNIVKRQNNVPMEGAQFYSERSTNLEVYREAEVSSVLDLPQKNEDTDRIPLVAPVEGFSQTWTNVQYRLGFNVTARALSAQKTRLIAQMMTGLPQTAQRKIEFAYASLFNEGFDTQTTADGAYIFSNSHLKEDAEAGTWDNLGTAGAFSTTSFYEAWLNFQTRTNEKGFVDPRVLDCVYYPVQIHEDVMKVHGSDKYPTDALNAKMPELFGAFKPVMGHWLSSTTAWFGLDKSSGPEKGFTIVWEQKPSYADLSYSDNPDVVMGKRLKMAYSVGALHSRNMYGNAGA